MKRDGVAVIGEVAGRDARRSGGDCWTHRYYRNMNYCSRII